MTNLASHAFTSVSENKSKKINVHGKISSWTRGRKGYMEKLLNFDPLCSDTTVPSNDKYFLSSFVRRVTYPKVSPIRLD